MTIIKEQYLSQIIEHAKSKAPNEVCGILAGKDGIVEKVYKTANVSDNPGLCYLMDPKEQLKIMKEIRNSGLEMAAIYHSHPHGASYPSKKDVELAFYPEASYIIVSLANQKDPELRCFRIIDEKITEEDIIKG